jgi:hypothetical protein
MQLADGLALVRHQPVIGVGQGTVGFEAHGLAGRQQLGKARMLAQAKAPAQRVRHQAVDRHGAQPFAFELQQGHGIGGQQVAQCGQQTAQTFALGQVLGQIGDQRADGVENVGCCHNDSVMCQKDIN